jgi:hypothetical protein
MPDWLRVAFAARAFGIALCQAERLPAWFVDRAARALANGEDVIDCDSLGLVRLRPGELTSEGRALDFETHTEGCRCMAVTRDRMFDAVPVELPADVPVLPFVSSVRVSFRRGNTFYVTSYGDRESRVYREADPPPHAPIVKEIETAINSDYGRYREPTVSARLDCGDRDEQWEFTSEFSRFSQMRIVSADPARDTFYLLAGLVIIVSQCVRAAMERALEQFAMQSVEASRLLARINRRELILDRGARVEMPRVEDLRFPQIVVEGETLQTAAQYAAFVEFCRRQPDEPRVEIPRAQHDDVTDAMNYARPPRPIPQAHGRGRLAGNLVWGNPIRMHAEPVVYGGALGVDFRRETTSAITSAMNERAEALLRSLLNAEQRESLDAYGYFDMTAQSGKVYRLSSAQRSFNVTLRGADGEFVAALCALPPDAYAVPMADQLIAQMLMLKSNEQKFLSTANWDR